MEDKFKFNELKNAIINMKHTLPIKLSNQAQNFFSKSFLTQSWEGKTWEEVRRRKQGTQEYKYPKKKDLGRRTRPILIGKGSTMLRRAVNNSIRVQVWPTVLLVVDLPYARIHNEGGDVRGRKMPKRQYMGVSPTLTKMHLNTINQAMKNLWK